MCVLFRTVNLVLTMFKRQMFYFQRRHPILNIVTQRLVDLPAPINLKYWWNFGSLLGLCLAAQIITGVFLGVHYSADVRISFSSVSHLRQDVPYGWLLRTSHANGASFFFICLYLHIGRSVYFGGFRLIYTWGVGVIILFLVIATAFLGYVLPWGQMSFWGTTVITNLLRAIPFVGEDIVIWLWGGFAVGNSTLTRFFSLHFALPFIVSFFVFLHLLFLHQTGSSNTLGIYHNSIKIRFSPYFIWKDLAGVLFLLLAFGNLVLACPWLLGDPENFIPANPLVTPVHIQPEWYFLFAYAILRAIPNKLGGVVALVRAVLILRILRAASLRAPVSAALRNPNKSTFWTLVATVFLLTWVGARPVEEPYILVGQRLSILYFTLFGIILVWYDWWNTKIML